MQQQHLASAEAETSVTRTGAVVGCRSKQVKRTISQAACEPAQPVQYSQQTATHMPQGKTLCGPASSPCNGSVLCISTPSLVDATGTLCKAGTAGTSDLADSRPNSMHLDLQQCAGSDAASQMLQDTQRPCIKVSAPAASLAVTPVAEATTAAPGAAHALSAITPLPGSCLLQQLQNLSYSLSEAVRWQDMPRQQLVLQLLKSFPMTPQLLLASQVGNVVQRVLQHTQKQHLQQQQVDTVTHAVAEAARALRRRWKSLVQAVVVAADRSQVHKACEALQGTPAVKKRKVQQLLTAVSKASTSTTTTTQHQHLRLQQLPLARSTSISKQQVPAPTANPTASADRQPASPTSASKLLSPAQKLQLLLSRTTTADAAASAKRNKRHNKRGRAQQHVTFGTIQHQADSSAPQQPHSLLQQLRAQQQQHPTLPAQQVPVSQVKRSRATKSSSQSKQMQQAAGALAKEQKLDNNTQQPDAAAMAGTLSAMQQQQPLSSHAVSPRGVHASWLTAFANRSISPAGNMQTGKAVPAGAITIGAECFVIGAAGQPGAAWAPAAITDVSISRLYSADAATHTPSTQFSLPPLPPVAGGLPNVGLPDAAAPSMPLDNSLPSAGAAPGGTTGCCASSDALLHPPPPHVTIRIGRPGASGLGHTPLPGSPEGGTAAKGQQNAMWGAGAMALRAAKGPGHHGSHHAHHAGHHAHHAGHHAHHAGQHAGRGGSDHVANHGPQTVQHTWPGALAAAAATQPCASSYHVARARHGSGVAGSMVPEQQRGMAGGVVTGLSPVGGRLSLGPGSTLINGCADRGGAEAAAVVLRAGCKPLSVRYTPDSLGSGSLGVSGGLGSAEFGSAGGLVASASQGGGGSAAGYMVCVDSDDEGPVLVDTRLQHGSSVLTGMESMPLVGAGLVLSPSL